MSTDVILYGVEPHIEIDGVAEPVPMIRQVQMEMGFTSLADILDHVAGAKPRLLLKVNTGEVGFEQWLVLDPIGLVEDIRSELGQHIWDSRGLGFDSGVGLMEEYPELRWWFHAYF